MVRYGDGHDRHVTMEATIVNRLRKEYPKWVSAEGERGRVETRVYDDLCRHFGEKPTKREFDREMAMVGKELAGDC